MRSRRTDARPRAPARPPSRALVLTAITVAAAGLVPPVYLVVRASDAGLAGAADLLLTARVAGLLARTVALALAVTVAATVIGVAAAWLTERTDLPAPRVWAVLLALPLVVPSYVGAYVVLAAFGPRGIVSTSLPAPTGFLGATIVLTLATYPYVFLAARAGLRSLDPALEEVAHSLGHGRRAAFRRVTLPLLRPSIAAGSLLVALYALHDFGAVSLLRYDTFTRAIFLRYTGSFDRTSAAVLSLALVALTLFVLAAEQRTRSRAAFHRAHAGSARPLRRIPLGRWRLPALALAAAIVAAGVGLPAVVVGAWLVRGLGAGSEVWGGLEPWLDSVRLAGIAAAATTIAAVPVALLAARHPGRLARAVERASYLGFGVPGLVVALSLVFLGARLVTPLYQTEGMLVLAHLVVFLSHAVGPLRAGVLQVAPAYEEAAASLGAGRMRTLRTVVAPLLWPGAGAALALVFLTVMKELPATLLLAPVGFETLATRVWSATNAASFGAAAAPALALVLVSAGPLWLLMARREAIR